MREGLKSVRVRDLQVGDILSPTNREVRGVFRPHDPAMRRKMCVVLRPVGETSSDRNYSVTWGADTTVAIVDKKGG